jgi:hypothetical protein
MWAPYKANLIRDRRADTPARAPLTFNSDFAGAVTYQAIARPADDEAATADTIGIMCKVVREDSQDPTVRAIAAAAASSGTDPLTGVHRWVRSHVRFREDADAARSLSGFDPSDTEVLIRPIDLIRMPQPAGDCDDFSMLTAAMLRALGIRVAFVTIAADPAAPDTYSHVYVSANGIPVDSSHGPRPGWRAPAAGKSRTWEVDDVFTRPSRHLGDTTDSTDTTWWQDIATIGAQGGIDIAKMIATPTGYYQQIGPNGQMITTRQSSTSPFTMPTTISGSNGTLLVFGGAALLLVLLIARK